MAFQCSILSSIVRLRGEEDMTWLISINQTFNIDKVASIKVESVNEESWFGWVVTKISTQI